MVRTPFLLWEIAWFENDLITRLIDCNSALALRNIDNNCVHETTPLNVLAMVDTSLLIAYSIYWVFHMNESSTCVKRTLRMRAGWLTSQRTLVPSF